MPGVFRFSFGPWNIHPGADPFGPAVRSDIPFQKKLAQYRKLGFGVSRQVDIEPGGTATVSLEVAPSTLSVIGTAGAEVFVDGVRAGAIPLSEFPVKLGRHDLMIVAPGGETRHSSVTVGTAPAQLDFTFTKP